MDLLALIDAEISKFQRARALLRQAFPEAFHPTPPTESPPRKAGRNALERTFAAQLDRMDRPFGKRGPGRPRGKAVGPSIASRVMGRLQEIREQSSEQLAEHLSMPIKQVRSCLGGLLRHGKVVAEGPRGKFRYSVEP